MNKQQLANKIWESANRMRSKIEANEYKDYILGFIFYKFLSDKEVDRLKKDGYGEDDNQDSICVRAGRSIGANRVYLYQNGLILWESYLGTYGI